MTFKELFAKMGINMDGEVTSPESNITPPPTPENNTAPENKPTSETNNEPKPPSSTVEPTGINAQLQRAADEIAQLKAANLALLQHTPVPENNTDSVEDMIYKCVIGTPNNSNE